MQGVVFFDVDNVLIKGQSQERLMWFLFINHKVPFLFFVRIIWEFFLYKFSLKNDLDDLRVKAISFLKGWDEAKIKELFRIFYITVLRPRIFVNGVQMIKKHIEAGREVVLVSASLCEIIEFLKEEMGLKYQISTKLEIKNGIYTGQILGAVPYGDSKVVYAKKFIMEHGFDVRDSHAYSDHFSDVRLLEFVKYAYVVNADIKMRNIAKENGWPIYYFDKVLG